MARSRSQLPTSISFKKVNDTYGHEAGDRALRLFAQVAEQALREDDLLARWGGEEFALALIDLDRHQAIKVLNRIREMLAAAHTGDHPRFTASFGVTDSAAADSLEQMMQIADAGLYASKQSGRNQVTIGEPSTESPSNTALTDADGNHAGNGRRRVRRPAMHEAAYEEEPRASGLEIR